MEAHETVEANSPRGDRPLVHGVSNLGCFDKLLLLSEGLAAIVRLIDTIDLIHASAAPSAFTQAAVLYDKRIYERWFT